MELWQGLIIAVVTVVGSIWAARIAGRTSVKVKELDVEGQAYIRADGITAGVLKTLQDELKTVKEERAADKKEHAEELAKRDERLDQIEKEIAKVRDHNNALISFAYRLVALARKYGYESEIPTPTPSGIHL